MVTYTPVNLTSARSEFSYSFEKTLKTLPIFRYTQIVNAHVLYNFKSPTSQFGEYNYILFIDIPYGRIDNKTNYCKWNNAFINSLAIAVRSIFEPDVIDADNNSLFTEDGSWDYKEQIEEERISLRKFVLEKVPDVKYFDLAVIYHVIAPKCKKKLYNDNFAINQDFPLEKAVGYSIELLGNKNVNALLLSEGGKSAVWKDFIFHFIEAADKHTRQGILTKKKVDAITRKNTSKRMEQIFNAIGNKMCIINGKAGTGKTMALLRILYNQIRKDDMEASHHCRLLTYNNMLVMDLKQTMKCIGEFAPNNLSISTLHKFFYDIYKKSPVRVLHMNQRKIDELFNLCITRVAKYNMLLKMANLKLSATDLPALVKEVKEMKIIRKEDYKEISQYNDYLFTSTKFDISKLDIYLKDYVDYKRKVFEREYHRKEFLNGYNVIIEQLYLIYHNLEEFEEKYHLATKYAKEVLYSAEFKKRYEELYDQFIVNAEKNLLNEIESLEALISDFSSELERLEIETNSKDNIFDPEHIKKEVKDSLKKIKKKVNWSKYILVDEAQDCSIFEKALLLELNGSDNTIVATGGHDQLIRTPKVNDWSICLGNHLVSEKISLSNMSHRQKGNIVKFLNAFSNAFNINTQLSATEEANNYGRVIIDCRLTSLPLDIINELYLSGKDYGCSNFENIMLLLPKEGYLETEPSNGKDVVIDCNSTINIKESSSTRKIKITLPEELCAIDGTVNDKREILNSTGQGNTRCLLYESCRGLEAWNVFCLDLDVFYNEQNNSKEADEYAMENAGLFENDKEMFQAQYASLWCYMAMTRAIDTLYIKLSNSYNAFSTRLLSVAKQIPNVEIIGGDYVLKRH